MDSREEIRPFFGEESEPVGEWSLHWTHVTDERRGTMADHLDARIAQFTADGMCAMCMAELDDDAVCPTCGFNPAVPRRPEWTPEQADDYVVTLPPAQLFDEYAPAEVDAA